MTTFEDARDRVAPSRTHPVRTHPVSELLSRYFAMTAPGRPRSAAMVPAERPRPVRAEELWDALGDFA